MVLVSAVICLSVIGVSSGANPRAIFQNDLWLVKWIALAGTTVGCMFMSNQSAVQFGYVAAVGGGIFLFIGVLLVLEMAYGTNDALVTKYDDTSDKRWAYLIVGCAGLAYATSIVIWALLIQYFGGDDCSHTNGFVSVTIVMSVIVTLLSLPEKVEQGALLPCSVIVLYCTWVCASAVVSIPANGDAKCEARHSKASDNTEQLMQALGVVFTIVCIGYATIRAASSGHDLSGGQPRPSTKALMDDEQGGGGEAAGQAEEDETDTVQYNYSFFQAVYCLGAMYLAMVLVDWRVEIHTKHDTYGDMSDWANVWIKMATQWLTFVLYIWTLIAPLVCKDRDFS